MEEIEPDGTWIGQTATTGTGKAGLFKDTWTFKDGNITSDSGAEYTYTVDATKKPKLIDITMGLPVADKRVRMGIYKIEKDTLTICHVITNKAKADARRPEEFDTTKRDDVVVLTFRKKK